jgi:hypothetical protein
MIHIYIIHGGTSNIWQYDPIVSISDPYHHYWRYPQCHDSYRVDESAEAATSRLSMGKAFALGFFIGKQKLTIERGIFG